MFRTDTDTEIQAIRGGEVDAIYPQPQLQLAALRGQSGLAVQTHQGAIIERLLAKGLPANRIEAVELQGGRAATCALRTRIRCETLTFANEISAS